MTVYFVGHVKIKNREAYDRYAAGFPGVFAKFKGTLLAADFDAQVMSGELDIDRLVIMSFPSKADLMAWMTSPEYQEIGVHREEGADVTAIMANALEG
ncbi:MAG: DUF1330 domain-containing protein [Pseudomonadota bacterium]